jgi:hypothetical protein
LAQGRLIRHGAGLREGLNRRWAAQSRGMNHVMPGGLPGPFPPPSFPDEERIFDVDAPTVIG